MTAPLTTPLPFFNEEGWIGTTDAHSVALRAKDWT